MRSNIMIILSIFVLATLNYSIYGKQKIKDHGETVLLELAPVDPRSIMQGDYMRLRYEIERAAHFSKLKNNQKRGYMVILPDENNVAQFVRFYDGKQLKDDEKLLHFSRKGGVQIMPDSFMFQEGHAKYYEDAKYGVFKFDKKRNHLLIGLAGEDRKIIETVEDTQ